MKRKLRLFGIATMMAILTACGSGEKREPSETDENKLPIEYTYEKDTIRYGEMSGAFSFVKEVEKTQSGCVIYYFETAINREEREACIVATDRVLSCIDGTLPEIEVAVFKPENYEGIAVYGNRLYTPMQPWDSVEYVTGVLLTAYGEWGNYGLAYGYANYLCKEAGLDYREVDGFQQMSSAELYDLNLLCFNENFVSPEDVEAAKNNACFFVKGYLSTHAEEDFLKLLSESGDTEGIQNANEILEAFYRENGVECKLTEIRYQYGGVTFGYAASCEYACFYIEKNWQDIYWSDNPMVSQNFLHEDYQAVRAFFECNARQMGQYQERFGFESYNNNLQVFFSNGTSVRDTSFYQVRNHTIYLKSVVSLMHEYIHFVMDGHDNLENKWTFEGFARHYERLYNDYAYGLWNHDYDNVEEVYDFREQLYINTYVEHIGRPIDVKTDYRYLNDFWVRVYEWADPNLTYASGASFVAYLVDNYGEQAVIQYIGTDIEYNAEWGKSYEELVQDWNDYINENYSWYSVE